MSDTVYAVFQVYIIGVVVAVFIFYKGGRRGRAQNVEYWATLFAVVWFVTLPIVLYKAIKGLIEENNKK